MSENIITIAKEELPNKAFSPMIKVPTFGTWRDARKRYPYPANNSNQNPGYTPEELLFATCFVGINDRKFDNNSRDCIERLSNLSIEDKQYLMVAFLEAFFVGPEEAKDAKQYAQQQVLGKPALSYTIPKEMFPSQGQSVTFSRPNSGVQMSADRAHQGPDINGCSLEEMLLSMCITHVDGTPVERTGNDPVVILDSWSIADVQYANLVFVNMFTIDNTQQELAKSLGKRLRLGNGQSEPESSTKSTTAKSSVKASEDSPS